MIRYAAPSIARRPASSPRQAAVIVLEASGWDSAVLRQVAGRFGPAHQESVHRAGAVCAVVPGVNSGDGWSSVEPVVVLGLWSGQVWLPGGYGQGGLDESGEGW